MEKRIDFIVDKLKSRIIEKYSISEMKLFGSTVRGNRRKDSDIDVLVILPRIDRKIEEDLFDIAYDLELEYDCLIDMIIFGEENLEERVAQTPFYQSVLSEGLAV
jgi:predicted nucleotidyltransferase